MYRAVFVLKSDRDDITVVSNCNDESDAWVKLVSQEAACGDRRSLDSTKELFVLKSFKSFKS